MNTEKLIAKGVEKHFDGQKVLFKIESLKEHFSGLLIYESDIVSIEEEDYVIAGDVNFDNATANDVAPKVEEEVPVGDIDVVVTQETLDMNPDLLGEGIEVGETITISVDEDQDETNMEETIQPEETE